ncbi:MAG: peptide-methionine (S)-S-oxide reductase MsrA [Isosphaeraceae bacterium]|nr:peptide-methionine (S)-S-oxide reductase MsrA [Isosphaeraceae bacterium]
MSKAMFGAGCFWGVEEAFRKLPGVLSTAVGYSGGTTDAPTYRDVCGGRTGHAEVVEIDFDPERIGYTQLLEVLFAIHDPTTLNRQGPDVGTQYRSAIYYFDDAQREAATAAIAALEASGRFRRPIVTEVTAAGPFHRAEEYHQQYIAKGGRSACAIH